MSGRDLLIFLAGTIGPSLLVSWAGCRLLIGAAPRWGLLDHPGDRKIHARPMPTAGGLAILLALLLPFAIGQCTLGSLVVSQSSGLRQMLPDFVLPHLPGLWQQSGRLWILLAGGTVLTGLGLWDDLRGLSWQFRLGVQVVVAAATVLAGFRMTLFVDTPLLTGLLSVLWIVGLINSFNMLDNMDGLSAGVAAIAAAMLAAAMLLTPEPGTGGGQLFVAGLLLVTLGGILGFLRHNWPPAAIFMGDAGSYLVGYLLATAALAGTFAGEPAPRHSVLAPLCVFAVPLYDTMSVVMIRLRAGRSPFVGDKSHFSHRLVQRGMTQTQSVLTIYLATATCGLAALVLHQVDRAGAIILLLSVALTLSLIAILESARPGLNAS